ncbi:MAG: hypothetical protein ACRDK9_13985 [Solirubrobacterales bacterium]
MKVGWWIAAVIAGLVVIGSLTTSGDNEGGGDDKPSTERPDPSSIKDAGTIEDEISDELQQKPYSDVIVGEVTVNCPDIIQDNLAAGRNTDCTARDQAGNLTEFRVRSIRKGEKYGVSAGEIAAGLSF